MAVEQVKLQIDTRGNEKQKEALRVLLDPNHPVRNLGYGGAAGGAKTFTGVAWQWMMRQKYPGTRGFFARNELKKIKESTYLSYLEFCEFYDIPEHQRGKWNEKYSKIVFENGSEIAFVDLSYKPRDPLYLRVGSMLFTDGFFEESNETHPKGVEMLQTRVGRWKNEKYGLPARTLETFNPDKGHVYSRYWLPFRDKKETPKQKFIRALLSDNKYLGEEYKNNLAGKSKITRERLLNGNFDYDDTPGKLFNFDALNDLRTNPLFNKTKYIVCDPARKGRDKAVITVWDGFEVLERVVYAVSTNDILEDKIRELSAKYGIPMRQVIVDEDGVGGGIVDHLKCKGFVNNSSPIDTRTPQQKRENKPKPNFGNLKTQCYFYLADLINEGIKYKEKDPETGEMVEKTAQLNASKIPEEDIQTLIQELDVMCEVDIDKDGKKKITPKEKIKEDLGRSPDWADNFMMRMWFELAPSKKAVAF